MTIYCRINRNLLLGRIISSKESQKYYSLCTVLDIFSIQDFKKARRHVQCELILIFCEENPPSTESSSTMPRIKSSTRGPWDGKASLGTFLALSRSRESRDDWGPLPSPCRPWYLEMLEIILGSTYNSKTIKNGILAESFLLNNE